MTPSICSGCILPANFPGIRFNPKGQCQWCEGSAREPDFDRARQNVEGMVRERLGTAPHYDIILAFSGGKDSSYTLKYLKTTFRARVLAMTVDNDFVSPRAYENCRRVTAALGVDHIFFRPNPTAMIEIYRESVRNDFHSRYSLARATAICNSCISVINTQIMNLASAHDVPIVAGGYVGGQVPTEDGFMKRNLDLAEPIRQPFLEKLGRVLSFESLRLFEQGGGGRREILMINPLTYLNRSEEELYAELSPLGWIKPEDTGKSSTNCLLNDYAIHVHQESLGFHPYVFEQATLVRRGLISREAALKKLSTDFQPDEFVDVERKIGLRPV